MIRKRRKAVQYSEIPNIIDIKGNEIFRGDYIKVIKTNIIYGPISNILEEITGSVDQSIKFAIYVNDKIFLLSNIIKIY